MSRICCNLISTNYIVLYKTFFDFVVSKIMEGAMDKRDPRSSPSSESKLKLFKFIISCLKFNKQNKHKKKEKKKKDGCQREVGN
jgi:hypothetical protein